eukprot:TRINITY_DN1631_c0_g1_i1.p1 TRINITY_DN1631_c0_g1~~TRINITY_DN1631_c0_g1_i1.p1  ORF type:complete len:546 (+),score=55.68 TRINITY_DN1631_c0_g1_i1:80-1639(+)
MNTSEIYQSLLEDTQASLATALSRIEALKSRQRHLLLENNKLKEQLRTAGIPEPNLYSDNQTIHKELQSAQSNQIQTGQGQGQGQGQELQQDKQSLSQYQTPGGSDGLTEDDFVDVLGLEEGDGVDNEENAKNVLNQHLQPIVIVTEDSEVPGYVLVEADQLQFLEVMTVIPAKDYVGVCPLPSPKDAEGYIRRKWWQSLEPINSTPKHQDWTTYLTRTSWATQVDHQQVLIDLAKEQGRYADSDYRGIIWKDREQEGRVKAFDFRATRETRRMLQEQLDLWTGTIGTIMEHPPTQHMEHDEEKKWLDLNQQSHAKLQSARSVSPKHGETAGVNLVMPIHLEPCKSVPSMSDESYLLSELHVRCLNNHLPSRHRFSTWELVYSTARHGISLQTLYRRSASARPPTILVVRDSAGYIFGCFTSEQWKVHPRYYGTGETFVFQLQPHLIAYDWNRQSETANEYFQYAQVDSLGVGGGPHFALWLDGELSRGSSGVCQTFGCGCLASQEDFGLMEVEVWTLR